MASAWGKSWGSAFGVAFGAVVLVTPVPAEGGGGGGFTQTTHQEQLETDLQKQIAQEDEIIILAVAQLIVHGAFS